jgi:hypothetical protein
MIAISKLVHIDRTHQVPVPGKLAFSADPISAFGFVFMPTSRTPARCSSFRTGEAHDMGLLRLVGEIIDVFAIFPQGHALIVGSASVLCADPMRMANEEAANLLLDTKVDHRAAGFVPQVTNAPLSPLALFVLRVLQSLPAPGVLLATRLLLGDLPKVLRPLALERTDAAPGDDQSLSGGSGNGWKAGFLRDPQ